MTGARPAIEIVDVHDDPDASVVAARHLLHHALPTDLGDDRFDHRFADALTAEHSELVGAIALADGHPIGFLGGPDDGERLRLEALVADHQHRRPTDVLDELLDRVRSDHPGRVVELWGRPALPHHETVAAEHHLGVHRELHQMRCPLPVQIDGVPTRAFRPGHDDEALRLLNNAAFAGHPDQGALAPEAFAAKLDEPGVSPDGIRLLTAAHLPPIDRPAEPATEVDPTDHLLGFCWTKIHHDRGLGEIFAIGLHPSMHGRGLGPGMTAAGLHWLSDQGFGTGMLYVEADNAPAIRTYERLGFCIVRTDRAWV